MGFFTNLKNYVTGGGADLSLEIPDVAKRGSSLQIRITAVIGESDIEAKNVSIRVQANEHIKISNVEVRNDNGENVQGDVDYEDVIYDVSSVIAAGLKLNADETYTWEASVEIPSDVQPTFNGKNARHKWRAIADLDTIGNNPDTGWIDFAVI